MQHITPDMVEASYCYLLTTLPFRRWKLPHPDRIRFRVMVTKERFGHWQGEPQGDTVGELAVSIGLVDSSDELHRTVGHEMVHIYQEKCGYRDNHGVHFMRLAKTVCRRHGWTTIGF